ncbi:MAG: ATP-binding protein [Rhodospirillaceae bacterium]
MILVSRNEAGVPEFIATICRDIREHKALERSLAEAREQAEETNHAKTAFLAAMSHELRTPLNAINGFSQLLLLNRNDALAEPQLQQIDTIHRAGQHLLKLIEDILDLAKIESGHLSVTPAALSLTEVAAEACESLAELAAQAGVTLHSCGLDHSLPPVHADATRVVQVVVNLISNAIKYNRGGGSVHVSVRGLDGQRVRLSVRDTGAGIPPERQGQVFEPFNRLGAELSGIEGTGIGLALSRTLTRLMGGTLSFVSTPGEGSTFWIELPTVAAGDPADEAAELVTVSV